MEFFSFILAVYNISSQQLFNLLEFLTLLTTVHHMCDHQKLTWLPQTHLIPQNKVLNEDLCSIKLHFLKNILIQLSARDLIGSTKLALFVIIQSLTNKMTNKKLEISSQPAENQVKQHRVLCPPPSLLPFSFLGAAIFLRFLNSFLSDH